jgi:hypothetical protein
VWAVVPVPSRHKNVPYFSGSAKWAPIARRLLESRFKLTAAWIRHRYMETPIMSAATQVALEEPWSLDWSADWQFLKVGRGE